LGGGTSLFGQSKTAGKLKLTSTVKYEDGLQILTYDVL